MTAKSTNIVLQIKISYKEGKISSPLSEIDKKNKKESFVIKAKIEKIANEFSVICSQYNRYLEIKTTERGAVAFLQNLLSEEFNSKYTILVELHHYHKDQPIFTESVFNFSPIWKDDVGKISMIEIIYFRNLYNQRIRNAIKCLSEISQFRSYEISD